MGFLNVGLSFFALKDWVLSTDRYIWLVQIQRNWVFATNSNFLILISLGPKKSIHFWYFKLKNFDLTEYKVWNIKGLAEIEGLKITVCGKNSIPLFSKKNVPIFSIFPESLCFPYFLRHLVTTKPILSIHRECKVFISNKAKN